MVSGQMEQANLCHMDPAKDLGPTPKSNGMLH